MFERPAALLIEEPDVDAKHFHHASHCTPPRVLDDKCVFLGALDDFSLIVACEFFVKVTTEAEVGKNGGFANVVSVCWRRVGVFSYFT